MLEWSFVSVSDLGDVGASQCRSHQEAESLKKMRHPNIVMYMGFLDMMDAISTDILVMDRNVARRALAL